jgi:hypothetical protein
MLKTARAAMLASAVLAGASSVAIAKPIVFPSRVASEPRAAKLTASGGSPDRIVHVKQAADLDRLESGRRYKFVVDAHGAIAVAPLPADAPSNEYVHPILAGGAPVLTAGGIRVDRVNGKVEHVIVDQDSKSYCPTSESLSEAARALASLGIPPAAIKMESHPPQCAPRVRQK